MEWRLTWTTLNNKSWKPFINQLTAINDQMTTNSGNFNFLVNFERMFTPKHGFVQFQNLPKPVTFCIYFPKKRLALGFCRTRKRKGFSGTHSRPAFHRGKKRFPRKKKSPKEKKASGKKTSEKKSPKEKNVCKKKLFVATWKIFVKTFSATNFEPRQNPFVDY